MDTDPSDTVVAKIINAVNDVSVADWDACAGSDHPFVSHAFLSSLEESGSVRPETGWGSYHIVIDDAAGKPMAILPMYLKGHSQGEYIFDHGWADAFERAGGRYYPKLLAAVPFTPATGPRFLVRPDQSHLRGRSMLLAAAIQAAEQLNVSSLHINFPLEADWQACGDAGLLQRTDQQFHWYNNDYRHFDDFLDSLASRKRKTIRKERRGALDAEIAIEWVTGSDLTEAHWDAFYAFYMDTGSRKWGRPYLTREFFSLIGARMPENILLIMCRRAGRYIAGALNFIGADTLYGRNWGCVEDHRFLHFEACYYQAIDFAIKHGLARVEAGAQGPHKIARGYIPTRIHSAHWIGDPRFREAVDDYLRQERREVDRHIAYLGETTPFKKSGMTSEGME